MIDYIMHASMYLPLIFLRRDWFQKIPMISQKLIDSWVEKFSTAMKGIALPNPHFFLIELFFFDP